MFDFSEFQSPFFVFSWQSALCVFFSFVFQNCFPTRVRPVKWEKKASSAPVWLQHSTQLSLNSHCKLTRGWRSLFFFLGTPYTIYELDRSSSMKQQHNKSANLEQGSIFLFHVFCFEFPDSNEEGEILNSVGKQRKYEQFFYAASIRFVSVCKTRN